MVDEKKSAPKQFKIHYIKSNAFRVILAEGVHGGITPNGKIQFAFYNERLPIPQMTVHELEPLGENAVRLKEEIKEMRVGRDGIIREVEAEILMDVKHAEVMLNWLKDHIDKVNELMKEEHGHNSSQ